MQEQQRLARSTPKRSLRLHGPEYSRTRGTAHPGPAEAALSIARAMHPARTSPLPLPGPALGPRRIAIVPERLESCIRRLEPADRALLDLSLNRGIPDAAMAPLLKTDPMRLAFKRARAIERVASRMGMTHPADLADVRTALMDLPSRAWMPLELQPAKAPPVLTPPEPANAEIVVRAAKPEVPGDPVGRAASFTLGGLSERAKRAYPRGGITARARRAAGALAIGAAAALALSRRS